MSFLLYMLKQRWFLYPVQSSFLEDWMDGHKLLLRIKLFIYVKKSSAIQSVLRNGKVDRITHKAYLVNYERRFL